MQYTTSINIETITPGQARKLLENQVGEQRRLRETWVARLAADMSGGRFKLSSDAILLICGRLANGQHRLAAVEAADTPQQFLVLRTDDESIFKILDSGLPRKTVDFLRIPYAPQVSAAATLALHYEAEALNAYTVIQSKASGTTRTVIIDYIEANAETFTRQATFVATLSAKHGVCPMTLALSLLHIASRYGWETEAMAYLESVFSGERQDAGFDFRERLIKNSTSRAKLPRVHIFALMMKCFQKFLHGTRPGLVRVVPDESFPRLKPKTEQKVAA